MRLTQKTAHYLRARYPKDVAHVLQSTLSKARARHPTVADSEITFADDSILRIQHGDLIPEGIRVHVVRYTPGEQASTVRSKVQPKAQKDDESGQSPLRGRDFKNGELFSPCPG